METKPIEIDINESPDENRALAGHVTTYLLQLQATLTESTMGIAKWVLTSLLAINGGAAIATWQIDMEPQFKLFACGAFVLGILSALLCGHLQVKNYTAAARPLGAFIGYWISVQLDGYRLAESENFEQLEQSLAKGGRLPTTFGWIAVGLFTLGTVLAGVGGFS